MGDLMKKYEQFGIKVLGKCKRCETTIFNIADKYRSADNEYICTDCAEEIRQNS